MEEVGSPKGQGEREEGGGAGSRGRHRLTGVPERRHGRCWGHRTGKEGVLKQEEGGGDEGAPCLPETGTWGDWPPLLQAARARG